MPDGYGGFVGDHYRMPAGPGSHVAYCRAGDLIVDWYDFGDDAPYESINLLIFGRSAQLRLIDLLGEDPGQTSHDLACRLALVFDSYFAVKTFAERHGVPFTTETNFWP
jgi:hypothetical protein